MESELKTKVWCPNSVAVIGPMLFLSAYLLWARFTYKIFYLLFNLATKMTSCAPNPECELHIWSKKKKNSLKPWRVSGYFHCGLSLRGQLVSGNCIRMKWLSLQHATSEILKDTKSQDEKVLLFLPSKLSWRPHLPCWVDFRTSLNKACRCVSHSTYTNVDSMGCVAATPSSLEEAECQSQCSKWKTP